MMEIGNIALQGLSVCDAIEQSTSTPATLHSDQQKSILHFDFFLFSFLFCTHTNTHARARANIIAILSLFNGIMH